MAINMPGLSKNGEQRQNREGVVEKKDQYKSTICKCQRKKLGGCYEREKAAADLAGTHKSRLHTKSGSILVCSAIY